MLGGAAITAACAALREAAEAAGAIVMAYSALAFAGGDAESVTVTMT